MFSAYTAAILRKTGQEALNMKKRTEKVKIYVPEKERIKRIPQQVMIMNRVITAAYTTLLR